MSLVGRFEFKKMLSLYNGHVEFMEGSPVHQSDLERVCASHAAAIFLLANKQTNVGCCMLLKFLLHASVDHRHDSWFLHLYQLQQRFGKVPIHAAAMWCQIYDAHPPDCPTGLQTDAQFAHCHRIQRWRMLHK